jgi:hypothetical protein
MAAMANHSSNAGGFIAWLGRVLMALVAGEELRVRRVIAGAVTRARRGHVLDLNANWHAGHDPAANPRVE